MKRLIFPAVSAVFFFSAHAAQVLHPEQDNRRFQSLRRLSDSEKQALDGKRQGSSARSATVPAKGAKK